jgi:hypothetical protein
MQVASALVGRGKLDKREGKSVRCGGGATARERGCERERVAEAELAWVVARKRKRRGKKRRRCRQGKERKRGGSGEGSDGRGEKKWEREGYDF